MRDADQPTEFSSSSDKGTQYIDNRGYVYVRDGISGDVLWIPRVTRFRKQICGQTPSNPGAVASTSSQAKTPVQITLETPQAKTPVAVKPKARKPISIAAVSKPKAKGVNVLSPAMAKRPVVAAVVVKPVVVQQVQQVVAQRKVVRIKQGGARATTACNGGTATHSGVRCGPQT